MCGPVNGSLHNIIFLELRIVRNSKVVNGSITDVTVLLLVVMAVVGTLHFSCFYVLASFTVFPDLVLGYAYDITPEFSLLIHQYMQ